MPHGRLEIWRERSFSLLFPVLLAYLPSPPSRVKREATPSASNRSLTKAFAGLRAEQTAASQQPTAYAYLISYG